MRPKRQVNLWRSDENEYARKRSANLWRYIFVVNLAKHKTTESIMAVVIGFQHDFNSYIPVIEIHTLAYCYQRFHICIKVQSVA